MPDMASSYSYTEHMETYITTPYQLTRNYLNELIDNIHKKVWVTKSPRLMDNLENN